MDETRYLVRTYRDSDCDQLAAIFSAVDPVRPVSGKTIRHEIDSLSRIPDCILRNDVVEDRASGAVVAAAAVFRMPFENDPKRPWIEAAVLPARQREGIGAHLYETAVAEASHQGATGLRVRVREGSATGRAFLSKRGFVERRRAWRSVLDVASADTSQLASLKEALSAAGIRFTTIAREGVDDEAVLRKVHDLDTEAGKDVPHVGKPTPVPFESWRQLFFGSPNFLPDAYFLAAAGDRYVGVSFGGREAAKPAVLHQSFTGTRRAYRGRKIALTLKLMLIDYAKRKGFTQIETFNDSLNASMWRINERLGFRKQDEELNLEKVFEPKPAS